MFAFLSVAGMWIVWHTIGIPAYLKHIKNQEGKNK